MPFDTNINTSSHDVPTKTRPERFACKVVMGNGRVEYGMFSHDEIKHMLENSEADGLPPYFVQL